MKKLVYSSIVFSLLVLGMSSCSKKDYTCVCKYIATGNLISTSTVSASSTEEASDECDDKESAFLVGDRCEIQN